MNLNEIFESKNNILNSLIELSDKEKSVSMMDVVDFLSFCFDFELLKDETSNIAKIYKAISKNFSLSDYLFFEKEDNSLIPIINNEINTIFVSILIDIFKTTNELNFFNLLINNKRDSIILLKSEYEDMYFVKKIIIIGSNINEVKEAELNNFLEVEDFLIGSLELVEFLAENKNQISDFIEFLYEKKYNR